MSPFFHGGFSGGFARWVEACVISLARAFEFLSGQYVSDTKYLAVKMDSIASKLCEAPLIATRASKKPDVLTYFIRKYRASLVIWLCFLCQCVLTVEAQAGGNTGMCT